MKLSDWIPTYPSPNDEDFQQTITAREEFRGFRGAPTEKEPSPGERYSHQEQVLRFVIQFPKILLYHQTGTGKTCSMVGVSEYYKNLFLSGTGTIREAHFIVPSKTLIEELQDQIICRCNAPDVYATNQAEIYTEKGISISRTKRLKPWYQIETHYKTAGLLMSLTDDEIVERFSDTLICIDEPQLFISTKSKKAEDLEGRAARRTAATARKQGFRAEAKLEQKAAKLAREGASISLDYQEISFQLNRLLRLAQRCKVIIATATPMINKLHELKDIMRLILTEEESAQFDELDLETTTVEEVFPFFNGKISYVRALDTGAVVTYQGEKDKGFYQYEGKKTKSQQILYISHMSKLQTRGYIKSISNQLDVPGKRSIYVGPRSASLLVYPNGEYGGEAFGTYMEELKGGKYVAKPALTKWLGDYEDDEGISILSCKYHAIVEIIKDNLANQTFLEPDEIAEKAKKLRKKAENIQEQLELLESHNMKVLQNKGTFFIFGEFKNGSGLGVLTTFLKGIGMVEFAEETSIFQATGKKNMSYCPASLKEEAKIRNNFKASGTLAGKKNIPTPWRFFFLVPDKSATVVRIAKEAMNSPQNWDGRYIKVFIISPVGTVGLNINHVTSGHLIASLWTKSAEYQALSRFIRVTSFTAVLKERKELAKRYGLTDYNTKELEVLVYKHAALPNKSSIKSFKTTAKEEKEQEREVSKTRRNKGKEKEDFSDEEELVSSEIAYDKEMEEYLANGNDDVAIDFSGAGTTSELLNNDGLDVAMYRHSEKLDRSIKRIEWLMAQCAYDCHLNYARNVRPTDKDGGPECRYGRCDFECFTGPEDLDLPVNFETYDILYSGPEVKDVIALIISLFQVPTPERPDPSVMTVAAIYVALPLYREAIIDMSLAKMIGERTPCRDRFGVKCFLGNSGDIFYLLRFFPTIPHTYLSSYYNDNLIGVASRPLVSIPRPVAFYEDLVAEALEKANTVEYFEWLNGLNIPSLAYLIQEAIARLVAGKEEQQKKRSPYITKTMEYGKNVIFHIHPPSLPEGPAVGRPRVKEMPKIDRIAADYKEKDYSMNPKVWIHTLYSVQTNGSSVAIMANYEKANGRTYVYDGTPLAWRQLIADEIVEYNPIIQLQIKERLLPYRAGAAFGISIHGGLFLIRDNAKGEERSDLRGKGRGHNCQSIDRDELLGIVARLRIPPDTKSRLFKSIEKTDRDDLVERFVSLNADWDMGQVNNWGSKLLKLYIYWSELAVSEGGTAEARQKGVLCEYLTKYLYANKLVYTIGAVA